MLDTLVGALGSAASGGMLGFLGSIAKGWLESREREAERRHQLAMRQMDLQEMEKEAELQLRQTEAELAGKARIATIEADAARDVADAELQAASYRNDAASYSTGVLATLSGAWGAIARLLLVLVDVVRGFMRPAITVYLLGLASLMTWQLHRLVQSVGTATPEQAWPLYQAAVEMVIFLTVACVAWWFGTRPTTKGRA